MDIVVFIFLFFVFATVVVAALSFAPWIPMKSRDLKRVFELADLKPGEKFYDLGCGNGKTVIYAIKNFSAKATGIELALPLYLWCQLKKLYLRKHLRKCVRFAWGNLFKQDLRDADVVYFFGMPDTVKNKLKKKLEKELKPGARVISYVFGIEGWEPVKVDRVREEDVKVYLYVI